MKWSEKDGGTGDQRLQLQQKHHKSPASTSSILHPLSLSSSPDFSGNTGHSHSSLSYYSPGVGKRSPQMLSHDSYSQPERSRSLSPVATEDLYSYRRSPLPKHKTPPSVNPLSHGSSGQTGLSSQHQQKVLINGHLHLGTAYGQSVQTHNSDKETAERNSKQQPQANPNDSSANLTGLAHLAGSLSGINHSPSSSPEMADSSTFSQSSKLPKRKQKASLAKHHYSSSLNFFNTSNESGGLLKFSEKYDSTLSLWSIASTSAVVEQRGDECVKHETAIMDLYILKQSSDFYHQLGVAWVNVKIVSRVPFLCVLSSIMQILYVCRSVCTCTIAIHCVVAE